MVIILLIVIAITLLAIEVTLKQQLKQSKEVENALYRLIEITKEQKN